MNTFLWNSFLGKLGTYIRIKQTFFFLATDMESNLTDFHAVSYSHKGFKQIMLLDKLLKIACQRLFFFFSIFSFHLNSRCQIENFFENCWGAEQHLMIPKTFICAMLNMTSTAGRVPTSCYTFQKKLLGQGGQIQSKNETKYR